MNTQEQVILSYVIAAITLTFKGIIIIAAILFTLLSTIFNTILLVPVLLIALGKWLVPKILTALVFGVILYLAFLGILEAIKMFSNL